jgi:rare lipoprotein A (peptidoglycan hydrolase)
MIRTFLWHGLGTLVILAYAVCAVFYAIPAHGGEPRCKAGEVKVSWYGAESGSKTAAGIPFDGSQWLVAHKTLRFGTKVQFTYHGRSVTAPVLDRGPYIKGRSYDLSSRVASALGMKANGVACVVAKVLR